MVTIDSGNRTHQTRLSKVLENLLIHSKLSTNAFAKEINLPTPTVHRILTGEVQDPRSSTLISIADYFGITIDQLLGKQALDERFNELGGIAKPPLSIPVLTITEAKEYEKHLNAPNDWLRWQNINKNDRHQSAINTFSILLKNNIYDPPFASGTYLIISPETEPASGDYALIKFSNDSSAVIKKYISEGDQKYLYPLKQDLKSIPLDQNDCSVIGVIIEMYLKLKS